MPDYNPGANGHNEDDSVQANDDPAKVSPLVSQVAKVDGSGTAEKEHGGDE